MRPLKKIAFVLEDFALQTPGQQLLDRFLMGYPRGEAFPQLQSAISVRLVGGTESDEIKRREKEFKLRSGLSLREADSGADGVVVAWRGSGAEANVELLKEVLRGTRAGTPCFLHGVLGSELSVAREIGKLASSRRVPLLAGTPLGVTWKLPPVEIPKNASITEALVVVQGSFPTAEFDGLEVLAPVIERRQGGEAGVRQVQFFQGNDLWRAGDEGKWGWPLLASALSRSDTPLGDSVKDGRTQDLVGLGLVQKLAREPRGWIVGHRDGLRSTILVLDGVVRDYNFAVRTKDGQILSAQIYRPPAPAEHHFTRLAEVIEDFFHTRKAPWPLERCVLISGLLQVFRDPASRNNRALETPDLNISYSPR